MTIDTSIPAFLDRAILPDGTRMTTAEIDALRLRLIKKHGTIKIMMARLSNPTRKKKPTGLGMSLQELKASVSAKKGA